MIYCMCGYIFGLHHHVFNPVLFVILNFVLTLLAPYFISILFLPFLIGLAFKFYPRLENENRKAFIKRRLFVALKVFAICVSGLIFCVLLWNDWLYPTSFAATVSVILLVIMRGKIFAGAKNPFVIPESDIKNKPSKKLLSILWIGFNSVMMALLLFALMSMSVRFRPNYKLEANENSQTNDSSYTTSLKDNKQVKETSK